MSNRLTAERLAFIEVVARSAQDSAYYDGITAHEVLELISRLHVTERERGAAQENDRLSREMLAKQCDLAREAERERDTALAIPKKLYLVMREYDSMTRFAVVLESVWATEKAAEREVAHLTEVHGSAETAYSVEEWEVRA